MNPQLLYKTYFSFFIFAFIFSLLIYSILLRFSRTLGMRIKDESLIRWQTQLKPSWGGIGFYIAFLLTVAVYPVFFPQGSILVNTQLLGFLAATTIAFLMGLADDAYNTKPLLKFIVQLACAIILIETGTYIQIFPNELANYFITLLWVVGIMNSINMLDNMDAIATIISICIIGFAIIERYLLNDFSNLYIFLLFGLLAALIAFLYYNWYPSKMYMGDTGSQFLGVILAAVGIICCWNTEDLHGARIQTKQFLVTAFTFIIPLCDTLAVIINRTLKGRSPFVGGRDHTTHFLFFNGVTERRIAILFAFITLVSLGLNLIILSIGDTWNLALFFGFSAWFFLVFGILFYFTRRKR
ncbi:MAG: MraY family glycosyltransferase [Bacteroidota bacterium]